MLDDDFDLESLIAKLIPLDVPYVEELRSFLLDRFRRINRSITNLKTFEIPDTPKSTLTQSQLKEIQEKCKGKIEEWPVPVYLASLLQTQDVPFRKSASQWLSANIYILVNLVFIGNHKDKIEMLCLRFRSAHAGNTYLWLWDQLPQLPLDLEDIVAALRVLQDQIVRDEGKNISKLPKKASARINEILRAYETVLLEKQKINRNRRKKTKSQAKEQAENYKTQKIGYQNNADFPSIGETIFPLDDPIEDMDVQEQQNDQKHPVFLDNLFKPQPGTEYSAPAQSVAIRMQAAHIRRRDFEFLTDPTIFALPSCQLLFKHLWRAFQDGDVASTCLLLSTLTATPAENWIAIDDLIKAKKLIIDHKKKGLAWRTSLDIADLKLKAIQELTINQQKQFDLPLPYEIISILQNNKFSDRTILNERIRALKKQLAIPLLSLSRLQGVLHSVLRRYTADQLMADLICGITPRHSPALYYSSYPLTTVYEQYAKAVKLLAQKTNTFTDGYLTPRITKDHYGSQLAPQPSLVKSFLKASYDHVLQQTDRFEQFNAYALWMWHIFLLLTSVRPVNHAPGLLNQIDTNANLIWISDKEGRETSSSGRLIPLCPFLCTALKDYLNYLDLFYQKYHVLNDFTYAQLQDILSSRRSLLNLFDTSKAKRKSAIELDIDRSPTLESITPSLVISELQHAFPLPLNWTRHFGRYYLTNKLPVHLIDTIFGHEQPEHEGLHPYSSLTVNDLKNAGQCFEQMAMDLELQRIQVDVI